QQAGTENPVTGQDLRRLEYDQGRVVQKENTITYDQKGWSNFQFQIHTKWEPTTATLKGSWSISSKTSETEKQETAEQVVARTLENGMTSAMESHIQWWHTFWDQSTIKVPDPILQNQWYMEMYKLGSAA